jgi:DNA-binding transcriptional regulator LsrR (DeoR family)
MPGENHPAERLRLLAKIAEMYYADGLSQQEIAERIRLSRPSISRLLVDARQAGIVEIAVNHPIPTVPALEAALERHFPLRRAHVFECKTAAEDETLRIVGRLGAIALSGARLGQRRARCRVVATPAATAPAASRADHRRRRRALP